MRIVCQQTIIIKYHALFVIFEKATKFVFAASCKLKVAFYGLILRSFHVVVYVKHKSSITVLFYFFAGYAYSQGVTESIMGILMAGGGLVGILGALLYPRVRRRVGIERTGLFGFFLEVAFLCLCVASVWAPGSPFDPLSQRKVPGSMVSRNDTAHNNATVYSNVTQANITIVLSDASSQEADSESVTNISVWLLLAGIIGARCGKLYVYLTLMMGCIIILLPYNNFGRDHSTVKPVLSGHSKRRLKIGFQDQLSLYAGQNYCRMLQWEHSAILSTFIKLPFVIKPFDLSIFEWLLKTGFTVHIKGHM